MNIEFGPELESFRQEVAAFLDTAPTPAIREAGRKTTSVFAPFEEAIAWQKILNAKGWAAPAWPKDYGGTGWSVEQRYIFAEECRRRQLPPLLNKLDATLAKLDSAAGNADAILGENRAAINSFANDGLGQLGPTLTELRGLVRDLRRVSDRLEGNPARYLLGRDAPKEFDPK